VLICWSLYLGEILRFRVSDIDSICIGADFAILFISSLCDCRSLGMFGCFGVSFISLLVNVLFLVMVSF